MDVVFLSLNQRRAVILYCTEEHLQKRVIVIYDWFLSLLFSISSTEVVYFIEFLVFPHIESVNSGFCYKYVKDDVF